MQKLLLIFLIFLSLNTFVNSQNKRDYKWIFGDTHIIGYHKAKCNIMDFNNHGHIDSLFLYEGVNNHNAEISDVEGNLLFYYNGCRVIDSTKQLMENGDSLNFGHTWEGYCGYNWSRYPGTQNAIILPDPGNDFSIRNGYYLIHKRQELVYEPNIEVSIPELYYTYVDMSGNNGRGTVIEKNKAIFKTTDIVSGYLSACKHANGVDWWLIQMQDDTNVYFKVLLTNDGFTVDSQRIVESPIFTPNSGVGQSVFTPDGKKWITNDWYDGCLIYDFDRTTGKLSNLVTVIPPNNILTYVGVAVSPNSRFVYLSNGVNLFQLDLLANDVPGSLEHIAHRDSFPDPNFFSTFGQAQLAPDCKIYIVSGATNNYLHVINKPDEKGKACDFQQHSVYLPHRNYNNCIPNFPHFRMDEADMR